MVRVRLCVPGMALSRQVLEQTDQLDHSDIKQSTGGAGVGKGVGLGVGAGVGTGVYKNTNTNTHTHTKQTNKFKFSQRTH